MKWLRVIIVCALAPILFGAAPTAKNVEVIGKGESEEAALFDAFRSALIKAAKIESPKY